ncbi:energy transducer TonB [Aquimarina sp. TRL1]|uniref:energy transducer TonB n=1 Tax=Aquimarina sp. (strain TRL1) TaxID=2736252 RepID=UPI00158BB0AC|nr:energy transducer TonB [Aquimarina sp. TRL1]QKX03824.1 energy transducer TonB [Aquimarina sp. TRL1]
MLKLDTKHKKRSMILTVIVHVGIILLLFYLSLSYLDPAPESGIAVNFGTTETGRGRQQPTKPIKSAPKETVEEEVEEVQEKTPEVSEKVITQDSEDAPVITEKPEKKTSVKKEEKKKPEKKPAKKKPVEKKPDPKPDKSTLDILNSFSKGPKSDGTAKGGEGDDNNPGDKGNPNGDPNARSYYGNGKGLDGDGNYRLGGRKALNKEKFRQDCNESGIVVVKIQVDQNGRVVKATPGVKGTTNSASCLLAPAKKAALATRFNSDSKAPVKQVGTIVYEFKLSE